MRDLYKMRVPFKSVRRQDKWQTWIYGRNQFYNKPILTQDAINALV